MTELLKEYLSKLNTSDSQWGLWVNPDNFDDFRIGQFCFENGGMIDDFVCAGDLSALSFGFQSYREAFSSRFDLKLKQAPEDFEWYASDHDQRFCQVNAEALFEAWEQWAWSGESKPAHPMFEYIEKEVDAEIANKIKEEVDFFVGDTLPNIMEQAAKDEAQAA